MKIRKLIAFAYPTSTTAELLGKSETGAWYVQQYIRNEAGEWNPPFIATGTEGDSFDRCDDPELIELFNECEGEICPYFLQHLNQPSKEALRELI